MADSVSAADPHPRKSVDLLGSTMRYVDTGSGAPVVLIHGNPTSSYLWRNVIPELAGNFRCLAPDLIGMGDSGKTRPANTHSPNTANSSMRGWIAVLPEGKLRLVVHDWGGALGFHWAARHPDRVAGIAYMETVVCPVRWADWPEQARGIFQGFRSPKGEDLILNRNLFIEGVLPNAVMRGLSDEELTVYRKPYVDGGEVRRPMLTWPRQIPIDGEPAEVVAIAEAYGAAMKESPIPKLFVNGKPGSILTGPAREFCRSWANQEEVTVKGLHFVQEDSPAKIGAACNDFFSRHAG